MNPFFNDFIIAYLVFIFLKCWNDSIYIKRKHVTPTHGLEWFQCAAVAVLAGMAYSDEFWIQVAVALYLLPVSWIIEDLVINLFFIQNPFTCVGSGWWDLMFKHNFPDHPARAIWVSKVALLFLASWNLYEKMY